MYSSTPFSDNDIDGVVVPDIDINLSDADIQYLQGHYNPLESSDYNGVDIYIQVINYLATLPWSDFCAIVWFYIRLALLSEMHPGNENNKFNKWTYIIQYYYYCNIDKHHKLLMMFQCVCYQ